MILKLVNDFASLPNLLREGFQFLWTLMDLLLQLEELEPLLIYQQLTPIIPMKISVLALIF